MIESLVDGLQRNTLPAAGVVTRLTGLRRETSTMRIGVAIGASIERYSDPSRLAVAPRRMTFLTSHLGMQPGERVAGLGVVELGSIFPVLEVVALLTILPQAAIVLILMAGNAVLTQPEESSGLVTNLDGKHFRLRNMFRRVTTIAGRSRVLSLQAVPSFAVIEAGSSRRPFDNRKIEAVMFRVTLRAFLAGIGF